MAEYRATRLICKHFGFTATDINEEVDYSEYWCFLAESMDAEELQRYYDFCLRASKKDMKKWKWQTPDHAGTRVVEAKKGQARATLLGFVEKLTRSKAKPTGSVDEIAKLRGLPKVYRDEQGNLFDEQGKSVESKAGLIFVPAKNNLVN